MHFEKVRILFTPKEITITYEPAPSSHPHDPHNGQPVFAGNDPKTCGHIYPITRDGLCYGCGAIHPETIAFGYFVAAPPFALRYGPRPEHLVRKYATLEAAKRSGRRLADKFKVPLVNYVDNPTCLNP